MSTDFTLFRYFKFISNHWQIITLIQIMPAYYRFWDIILSLLMCSGIRWWWVISGARFACVHKDELVVGIGSPWIHERVSKLPLSAYPRVLSALGKISSSSDYSVPLKMIKYLYHFSTSLQKRKLILTQMNTQPNTVAHTPLNGRPHYFLDDANNRLDLIQRLEKMYDFYPMGFATTLGFALSKSCQRMFTLPSTWGRSRSIHKPLLCAGTWTLACYKTITANNSIWCRTSDGRNRPHSRTQRFWSGLYVCHEGYFWQHKRWRFTRYFSSWVKEQS